MMPKLAHPFLTLILTGLFASSAWARGDCPPTNVGIDPLLNGKAIVRLSAGTSIEAFLSALNANYPGLNAASIDSLPSRSLHLLQFVPPSNSDPLETHLENGYNGMLQYGELLWAAGAPEGKTGTVWADSVIELSIYTSQYAVDRIGLTAAHKLSTGSGTVVAVLDTGVDASHPALADRIATGGYNFFNSSTNTLDLGDGADNDGDGFIDEMVGHGTYVAGLIALTAPDARILPITVLNPDGVGDMWSITRGIYHAIDKGVEVINLSISSTYGSIAVEAAILEAGSRGIAVVAAAGNFDRWCPREYPAMEDDTGVIGVAALDHGDVKASFSNYNKRLFISAPGASTVVGGAPSLDESIVSTIPGGGYRVWEGTSMAAPLVAGAAALIRSQHPQWPANSTTLNMIRARLAQTAVNIYSLNPQFAEDTELGVGRVNVGAAVALGVAAPALGDLNADGIVSVDDLLTLLSAWGQTHSSADLNGDGTVNVDDLLMLLARWG